MERASRTPPIKRSKLPTLPIEMRDLLQMKDDITATRTIVEDLKLIVKGNGKMGLVDQMHCQGDDIQKLKASVNIISGCCKSKEEVDKDKRIFRRDNIAKIIVGILLCAFGYYAPGIFAAISELITR